MLFVLCSQCGRLTPGPKRLCGRCQDALPETRREQSAGYDKLRDPASVRFYHSAAWKRLRLHKLARAGWMCEECMDEVQRGLRREEDIQPATDVHHMVPLALDWSRRLDITNLKADCAAHHNAERAKEIPPGAVKKV